MELTPKQLFIRHRGSLYGMKDLAGYVGASEGAIYNRLASEKELKHEVPEPIVTMGLKKYYLKEPFLKWWNSFNHTAPVDNTKVTCVVDGITYPSIMEASRQTGIPSSTLACRLIAAKKKELS